MADRTVTIALKAKDELTPVLKGAAQSASDLARELGKGDAGKTDKMRAAVTSEAEAIKRVKDEAYAASKAVQDFVSHGVQTQTVAHNAETAAAAWAKVPESFKAVNEAGKDLGMRAGIVAGAFALTMKPIADFDRAMSLVKAGTMASADEIGRLRDAALSLDNANIGFGPTQAAKAITELGKAGVSTKDILGGGLKGALTLAAAGEMEVGAAAEASASAMNQFNLNGGQVGHIADLLAAGAGKAQGEVKDMTLALSQVGLVAHGTGATIEETTGTLAAFAAAGLLGSDAGTSMKTMLQRLTPTSKEAANEMDRLGVHAYDTNGKFVGMANFAGILRDKLYRLTDEQRNTSLAIMFGSDAVRAANILYEQGATGMQDWINKTNDAGFAARNAATKMDNLQGDLSKLKAALEVTLIQNGSGANDGLRSMTQTLTGLLDVVRGIPGPVLEGAAALAAWLALGGKIGAFGQAVTGAFKNVAGAVSEATAAAVASGAKMGPATTAMVGFKAAAGGVLSALGGPYGLAVAGAAIAVTQFAEAKAKATQNVRDFVTAIESETDKTQTNTRAAVVAKMESEGLSQKLQQQGIDLKLATDAIMGQGNAMTRVTDLIKAKAAATESGISSERRAGTAAQEQGNVLNGLKAQLDEARAAQERKTQAMGNATVATERAKAKIDEISAAEKQAADETKSFEFAIKVLTNSLDMQGAADAFTTKVHELANAVDKSSGALSGETDAAIKNREQMRELVKSAAVVIDQMVKQGVSHDVVTQAANRMADQIQDAGHKANLAGKDVDNYAQSIRDIPAQAMTEIRVNADEALRNLTDVQSMMNAITSKTVTVDVIRRELGDIAGVTSRGGLTQADGGIVQFARGGFWGERRYAQIAKPGEWRLWAEPETGGEAYIPLAKSKRARSEAILAEVAKRFGMSLSRFANGGVMSGPMQAVSVSPFAGAAELSRVTANAGSGASVTVNNYNPVAEPASVTTNRALRQMALLNMGG